MIRAARASSRAIFAIIKSIALQGNDEPMVLAKKEFAERTAVAGGITYHIICGGNAEKQLYRQLFHRQQAVQAMLWDDEKVC